MKRILIFSVLSLWMASCDNTTSLIEKEVEPAVVPVPKEITTGPKTLILDANSKIYAAESELGPLTQLFADELSSGIGIALELSQNQDKYADIIFSLDTDLATDAYKIEVTDVVHVSGGSYQAVAMARSTLLQLVFEHNGALAIPQVSLADVPDTKYRGLMIDLARQWHSVETIKSLIDLASYYKSNYIHLHFTDYQSYTLPSKKYPKLSTEGRQYSFSDLESMEAYAQLRGITLIPEIDIPGHASSIVKAYPELFGLKDIDENPWTINMGKEEVYEALETIFEEIIPVFKSTPYIHIGGDEAIFHKVADDPDVKAYMKAHELGDDVHELYRHFLVRMNDIIKKQGKQMAVWEGFRKEGIVPIPKDMIVYEFETNRYLPGDLVADGYTVVNTSWKPLYVVNRKKFAPETIYNWNISRWENWFPRAPSFNPIQLESSPLIIGAQMCAWEQGQTVEFRSLRRRLPVMNERIWNTAKKESFEGFMNRLEMTDQRLSQLTGIAEQDSALHGYDYVDDRPKK
ncbi:MAG: hypothetical protein Roseis2KO_22950 [Roseivirga sp.]